MKLGLGLGVNSITSQKVGEGFTGILDEYSGAVVAYSPNRLSSLYSSTMFRTRRSSDNAEDDIGFGSDNLLDTTALTTFVNEDVNLFTSDYSSGGVAEPTGSNFTVTINETKEGETECLKAVWDGTSPAQLFKLNFLPIEQGVTFDISAEFYLEGFVSLRMGPNGNLGGLNSTTDEWETYTQTITVNNTNDDFVVSMNGGTSGSTIWLKNIVITQTTADGAVSVYEDQVDSTYNKETSDFSVGTNSYTSISGFDTLTRLDDFEGVNNVLKLEATTGATSAHQMRKNIGQKDHFRYRVSCKIYIPTTNTGITKVALYNGVDIYRVIDKATEGDQWVTLENEDYFGSANPRFFVVGLNDAEDLSFASTTGDKFYLADVVIDGNYDLSNRTSDEQPLIVDGGTTETDNFIDFDGSNDRLVTKAIDAFQGDFTIDLEVDFTDMTTRQAIFTNRTTTSDRFGLTVWNTHLYFDYYDGATYTGGRVASMTAGTYKITLTRESGVFTIYLNGVSQTIASLGGLLGSTQDDQMTLGDYRNVTNPTQPYSGRVRTCIVYDSAQPEAHATAFNSLFS